ncbi:hypothetical protein [Paenibacillus apis]|uniref:Uncharacterized protein n=1 Tax=Paenibacillus apis TaxID=1792174 RepID=A0A919Y0B2_9BACL|nr:hypothetical protein [Paenibacillus apis]GIO41761.1 hypothetical protein J41TS4_15190 [Paenibacillus apis]
MEILWGIGKFFLFIGGIGLAIYVYSLTIRGLNQIPDHDDKKAKDND